MDKFLVNKTALVVGGNGGIGSEIVSSLLEKRFKVYACYNNNKDKLEILEKSHKENLVSIQMNLLDESSVKSAFDKIFAYGRVDVVVFSATLDIVNKPLLGTEWEDFNEHLNIQVNGLFRVLHNLKEQIKSKHKTKFIIISTEYCIGKPPAGLAHYITAKYGLMGLAKCMAVELPKYNCTVNIISPGMTGTDILSLLPLKLIELTSASNPLRRIANPKDIAETVVFLSGDSSDYLNGVNITVNGGGVML